MRDVPIIGKFAIIMACFGLFALVVAGYSGSQIWKIDRSYTSLLTHESDAALALSFANESFQSGRSAIGDLLMSQTDELNANSKKALTEARDKFTKSMDVAIRIFPNDNAISDLKSEGLKVLDQDCSDTLQQAGASRFDADVIISQLVFLKDCQPNFPPLTAKINAYSQKLSSTMVARNVELVDVSKGTIAITLGVILVGSLAVMSAGFACLNIWLVRPIKRLSATMRTLANGDLTVSVEGLKREDEVGSMANAVQTFKERGMLAKALEAQADDMRTRADADRQRGAEIKQREAEAMTQVTSSIAEGLRQLAKGNLELELSHPFAEHFESLRDDFNTAAAQLRETLLAVSQVAVSIHSGTRAMSEGAVDLSKRTEHQAASLEETAAALDQITANVSCSSQKAEEARTIAIQASISASNSGVVVENAVDAMQRIESSSQQIFNIIGVIDEIAFQTNLLALNAGVEAARAGESGKGFAVVAQEVRELAQRAAHAAQQIKELIRNSSEVVASGVTLVSETGVALRTIEAHVLTINQHMDAIALSSKEQATGLVEINAALNQIDHVTQENAAMVENSNAACVSLAKEAEQLGQLIAQFKLGTGEIQHQQLLRQTA